MDTLKKALGNPPVFVVAYILFMLPSYYLPYVGSNSSVLHTVDAAAGTHALNHAFWLHFGSMLVLCALCWIRGAAIGKNWLVIFPILAIVFDFVPGLSLIPLIPTVMHLLAIVLGVAGVRAVAAACTKHAAPLVRILKLAPPAAQSSGALAPPDQLQLQTTRIRSGKSQLQEGSNREGPMVRRPFRRILVAIGVAMVGTVLLRCGHESGVGPGSSPITDTTGIGGDPGSGVPAALSCGKGGTSSPGNPYPCCENGGNCTWWVWETAGSLWGHSLPAGTANSWHNAKYWATNAASAGYPVGDYPSLSTPTIAVSTSGGAGHVAMVTGMACAAHQVVVSEMNCCYPGNNFCGTGSPVSAHADSMAGPRIHNYGYGPGGFFTKFIYPLGSTPETADPCTNPGGQSTIGLVPSTLSFVWQLNTPAPPAKSFTISNTGGGTLSWAASTNQSWLSVSPTSGTGTAGPTVTINTAGLTAQTYSGTVTVAATGATNTPQTVGVTLTVTAPTQSPTIGLNPTSLSFNWQQNSPAPQAQSFTISNTGGGTLSWAASTNQSWLSVSPTSGTGPASVTVSVNTAGLTAGSYSTAITVSAAGASNTPQLATVNLTVTAGPVPTQLILNGGFEAGPSGWNANGAYATTILPNPHTGVGYAYWGADASGTPIDSAFADMYQTVTIAPTSQSASLTFWYYITTQETSTTTPFDVMNVTVQDASGAFLAPVATFSNLHAGSGYNQLTLNLNMSTFRGRTVRLNFLATSDNSLPTVFRIDDVSLISVQ